MNIYENPTPDYDTEWPNLTPIEELDLDYSDTSTNYLDNFEEELEGTMPAVKDHRIVKFILNGSDFSVLTTLDQNFYSEEEAHYEAFSNAGVGSFSNVIDQLSGEDSIDKFRVYYLATSKMFYGYMACHSDILISTLDYLSGILQTSNFPYAAMGKASSKLRDWNNLRSLQSELDSLTAKFTTNYGVHPDDLVWTHETLHGLQAE